MDSEIPYWQQKPGVAPIKPEYVLWNKLNSSAADDDGIDDDAAEGRTSHAKPQRDVEVQQQEREGADREPADKKPRLSGAQKKALAKERAAQAKAEGRNKRGQNKARKFDHRIGVESVKLCFATAQGKECERLANGNCNMSHDLKAYLEVRPSDVQLSLPPSADDLTPSTSTAVCPLFAEKGECSFGVKCRFAASHIKQVPEGTGIFGSNVEVVVDNEKAQRLKNEGKFDEKNVISLDTIRMTRGANGPTKEEFFASSYSYLTSVGEPIERTFEAKNKRKQADTDKPVPQANVAEEQDEKPGASTSNGFSKDNPPDLAPIRATEKKRLDFRGKLYLAPLTTVGNLPFRRLCNAFGNDITCAEMGLASEFLSGNKNEWSLVRRHHTEKMFGVQICGSRPQTLVPAAEAIVKTCDIDFMDVNCGCPIDLVFNKGGGSALMGHVTRLAKSLVGMNKVLGEVPVTIKIRTGIAATQPIAHKLAPRAQNEWGVSALTLHGRSRQQRYKTRADYAYIAQVRQAMLEAAEEADIEPIPFFANGDAYDWKSYHDNVEQTSVDGIMIARGALIKPWIFTEIKERRDWDISSRERLGMIGQLANYGLEHWGSDTMGINTTRRFLCEAMSFTHRYVPVGLLERTMGMNERALPYRGRDELETLLASSSSEDWVKISSMFLGPPPEGWSFVPKHKANSTDSSNSEVQG